MSNFQQPFPNNQYPPQPPAMGQQHYNQQYQQQNVQPNMQQGNFPQFNQGQGGPNTGFSIPNVSPEMLNMGFSAGQDMLNKQREKWMPGVSSFWLSLKYYFAVSYENEVVVTAMFAFNIVVMYLLALCIGEQNICLAKNENSRLPAALYSLE